MSPERKIPTGILIGIIAAFVLGVGGLLIIGLAEKSRSGLPLLGQVPEFEFIKQDGAPFGLKDMKGKISVVDFIFTSCQTICPPMSGNMQTLYDQFEGADNVQFVSITVDPERDSLSVLQEYARDFGVDDGRWVFLWQPIEKVVWLSEKGFMISARELPMGHSSRFVLVDPHGMIRGYYDGVDDESMIVLLQDIRKLAGDS
jgi:protein SCO1/2